MSCPRQYSGKYPRLSRGRPGFDSPPGRLHFCQLLHKERLNFISSNFSSFLITLIKLALDVLSSYPFSPVLYPFLFNFLTFLISAIYSSQQSLLLPSPPPRRVHHGSGSFQMQFPALLDSASSSLPFCKIVGEHDIPSSGTCSPSAKGIMQVYQLLFTFGCYFYRFFNLLITFV